MCIKFKKINQDHQFCNGKMMTLRLKESNNAFDFNSGHAKRTLNVLKKRLCFPCNCCVIK